MLACSGCVTFSTIDSTDTIVLHFIDVGYGDAILIEKGNTTCLIDGGYPPMTDNVMEYLSAVNIQQLTAAVLTHPHPDHIGGLNGVLSRGIPVQAIYSAYPLDSSDMPAGFKQLVKDLATPFYVVSDGDVIQLPNGLVMSVINPVTIGPDMNDSSMVLYIAENNGILLTGDIGPTPQKQILERNPLLFPISILKAPHHGGQSSVEFYQAARPDLTVISDGINPYGNPWEETLEMAEENSRRVIRLSESGSIKVTKSGSDPRWKIEMVQE